MSNIDRRTPAGRPETCFISWSPKNVILEKWWRHQKWWFTKISTTSKYSQHHLSQVCKVSWNEQLRFKSYMGGAPKKSRLNRVKAFRWATKLSMWPFFANETSQIFVEIKLLIILIKCRVCVVTVCQRIVLSFTLDPSALYSQSILTES